MSQAIKEALKEAGRVIYLAVAPLLIVQLEAGAIDWRLLAVTAVLAMLRAGDKYVHESKATRANGIVPF